MLRIVTYGFSLVLLTVVAVEGAIGDAGGRTPNYLWPLGNTTVHKEVMQGHDAHLPDVSQCFIFQKGYPGLPYDAITLGPPGAFVDFSFSGEIDFQDLSLSFYVYPEGTNTQGTLLSYKCATGNVIRLAVMQGLFFVSFWDEYGVSVGMTAIPSLLNGGAWNHIVLIREYATGKLQIYHDGEIMEDLDDDFPNGIQLPTTGSMRLGRGQQEADQGFRGRYSCLQFFDAVLSRDDVRNLPANCRPESWNLTPEVTLVTKEINKEEKQCVADYAPRVILEPIDLQIKAVKCNVLGLHCVSGSAAWQTVMRKHKWVDSERAVAYYHIVARGRLPVVPEGDERLLGKVAASDRRVCSRLCMRIKGCLAFAFHAISPYGVECYLYNSVLKPTEEASEGTRYYAMRVDSNKG